MKKRKILHVIDSLGRGGAETLLVGVVNSLPEFEHLIVSLKPVNEFSEELRGVKVIFLNFKWYHSIPSAALQLKSIIALNEVDVVHANLFWSVIVSRFATPKPVKLINSYHAIIYGEEGGNYPFYAKLLDRLSYNKRVITFCVSNEVRKNLIKYIGINKNVHLMYNFIDDDFFKCFRPAPPVEDSLRMVAVGNLKEDKNYKLVIDAFSSLSPPNQNRISLDVFGKGYLMEELKQRCIEKEVTNICFKGSVTNVAALLPSYDLFIISSKTEGFGIAVIEAMAVGLPVLVSDLPVLKEVTHGNAFFFKSGEVKDLKNTIEKILLQPEELKGMSQRGFAISQEYKKPKYLRKLSEFYSS